MSKQENKNFGRFHSLRNYIIYGVLIVTAGITVQYAVFSVLAVKQKMKTFNQQVDTSLLPLNDKVMDSVTIDLFKKKVFLGTRFQMSKNDSINLSVNLKDSVLQLELKGVVLKSTKITNFEIDQVFYQLKPATYEHLFGKHSRATSDLSTIIKIPIVVKQAPKDTTEVKIQTAAIDPSKTAAVHWMLKLDKEIVLKIEGSDQFTGGDWWTEKKFWLHQDMENFNYKLSETIRFRTPEYYPEIRLAVSEAEAKAIYRALPNRPFVSIRL